jgi:hypothetical protein
VGQAHVAQSDRETLDALVEGVIDFQQTTWIAPEYADIAGGVPSLDTNAAEITKIDFPRPDKVVVDVRNTDGGWLVLHEQWAPGWKAHCEGQELPLVRADHVYRAVPLPSVDHASIVFAYHPEPLRLGGWLCLGGLFGALLLDFLFLRKGRRSLI